MVAMKRYGDPAVYGDYYRNQAGRGQPYFQGAPVMYGAGIGGFFKSLFRRALPFLKRGFEMVKPHVKKAAAGIAKDVIGGVSSAVFDRLDRQPQEGSGLVYTPTSASKRGRSKSDRSGPPQAHKKSRTSSKAVHKRKSSGKKRSCKKRGGSSINIF